MQVFAVVTIIASVLGGEKTFEMPSASMEYCKSNKDYIVKTISNDLKASISEFKIKYECKMRA